MIRGTCGKAMILALLVSACAQAAPVVITLRTEPTGASVYLVTSSTTDKGLFLGTTDKPIPIEERFLKDRASLDLRLEKEGYHHVDHNLKTLAVTEGAVLPTDGPVMLPRNGANLGGILAVACGGMIFSMLILRRRSEEQGASLETVEAGSVHRSLDPLIGLEVCGYILDKAIDKGGMGTVYRALQKGGQVVAAVKVVDLTGHPESSHQRFYRELAVASKLHHPAIVQTWDYCLLEERYLAIVMEFLEGHPLAKAVRPGSYSAGQMLDLLEPVFGALSYLHDKGIAHRDVKPQNIFVSPNGRAKLIDFGLARGEGQDAITKTGMLVGTPRYMAPEQITRKEEITGKADQYALGLVMFEFITGRPPFDVEDPRKLLMDHLCHDPTLAHQVNTEVPERFAKALARMYARKTEERYPSMEDALMALRGTL